MCAKFTLWYSAWVLLHSFRLEPSYGVKLFNVTS